MGDTPPDPAHRRPSGAGGASPPVRTLDDLLDDRPLLTALERGQSRGYIGGDLHPHIEQAYQFVAAVDADSPDSAIDLGSGGGLPGLVLALAWPNSTWLLVDSNLQRTQHLEDVVDNLGISSRVSVLWCRAEDVARTTQRRATSDLVVARSFGLPAVVAECAAPLLAVDGRLVVSDPPSGPGHRWPTEHLAELGLGPATSVGRCSVMTCVEVTSSRFPRRVGIPDKRPLWLA